MRKLLFLVLSSLCLILLGCDQFLSPGGAYQDANLSFTYPPGWSVSVENPRPGTAAYAVIVRGPDHTFLFLFCRPAGPSMPLRAFADSFGSQRDKGVEQRGRIGSHSFFGPGPSTLEPSKERVAGTEVDGFRQSFSFSMLGVEVPFESHFSRISDTRHTLSIVTQNSMRHSAEAEPSFAAILGSLRLLPADAPPGG